MDSAASQTEVERPQDSAASRGSHQEGEGSKGDDGNKKAIKKRTKTGCMSTYSSSLTRPSILSLQPTVRLYEARGSLSYKHCICLQAYFAF